MKGKNTMNTTNTSNTEKAIIDRVMVKAFIHATDYCLTDENKDAAQMLANALCAYLGLGDKVQDGSPIMPFAAGFVLGMNEGLDLAKNIDNYKG